jgi:hypothetical protein
MSGFVPAGQGFEETTNTAESEIWDDVEFESVDFSVVKLDVEEVLELVEFLLGLFE